MKTTVKVSFATFIMVACAIMTANAQKGVGEEIGLARQQVQPAMVRIAGTLDRIKVGPCENTTGRSYIGTHLFLKQKNGDIINLHLGPESAVKEFVASLSPGDTIEADAFRTVNHKDGDMVAKTVTAGERSLKLRDDNLRPIWADGAASKPGRRFYNRPFRR